MENINIRSDSKNEIAKLLSNLALTPFSYGGYDFKCVEAPLQGIKFKDRKKREKIFKMDGISALIEGRKITEQIKDGETRYVYWGNDKYLYNSEEHRLLINAFIGEKIRQNKNVQDALIKTKNNFIYHDVGLENPNTSLPEKLFIEILLGYRKILLKLKKLK